MHDAVSVPLIQAAMIQDIPVLAKFFKMYPNAAGYHPDFITDWIDLLGYGCALFIVVLPTAFITMHLIFRRRMKELKSVFNKNTIKAHQMLYRYVHIYVDG